MRIICFTIIGARISLTPTPQITKKGSQGIWVAAWRFKSHTEVIANTGVSHFQNKGRANTFPLPGAAVLVFVTASIVSATEFFSWLASNANSALSPCPSKITFLKSCIFDGSKYKYSYNLGLYCLSCSISILLYNLLISSFSSSPISPLFCNFSKNSCFIELGFVLKYLFCS